MDVSRSKRGRRADFRVASIGPKQKGKDNILTFLQTRREQRRLRDQQRAQAYAGRPPLTEQGYGTQPTRPVFQGRPIRLPGGDFQLLYLERHQQDPRSSTRPQTDTAQREPARLRLLHWDVQDRRPDPERCFPHDSINTSPNLPRPFLSELGRYRDVSNLGPGPGRRYVQETIPPIPSIPSLLSREIGDRIRDVSRLRLDLGRRYVPEAIPPPAGAPSPSPGEIVQKKEDVSNLKPDSERQGVPEAVLLPPETLLPISGEISRPLDEVRRRTRETTPPRGNQFVERLGH